MPRTFAGCVLPLLTALAPLSPEKALGGPPEGVSGKMAFVDMVTDGLRQYRREADAGKRIKWLTKLAPTRDPRVAVVLGEAVEESDARPANVYPDPGVAAHVLLHVHYIPGGSGVGRTVRDWWDMNKADLHRRARLLPR